MSKTGAYRDSFLPPLWIITLLGLALTLWLVMQLRELLVLLVLTYTLAFLIDPAADWLERKGVARKFGVFIVLLIAFATITVIFIAAAPTVIQEFRRLLGEFPNYWQKAREVITPYIEKVKPFLPAPKPGEPESPAGMLSTVISPDAINTLVGGASAALLRGYSITLAVVNMLLLPFTVYYLAVDFDYFHKFLLGLFPRKAQPKVKSFFSEINFYVSAFVRGQLLVCTTLFILFAIGLGIIGVDLWFLLALISGYGQLIPYVGFISGIVLSSIMALVTFGDAAHLFQVWIVYGIIQMLESFVITPRIIGTSTGLSPLIIIIALFAGGQLFGLLGVLLAVPLAAVVRVAGKHLHLWILEKSKV